MNPHAVVLADQESHEWLRIHVGEIVELESRGIRTADELQRSLAASPDVKIIFVQFDNWQTETQAKLVEHLTDWMPELPIVAISNKDDTTVVLRAMRAGARDFLVRGRDDEQAGRLVMKVLRRGVAREPGRASRTLTVVSAQPDTGTAFLAGHLALLAVEALAPKDEVLLIDLAHPAGASLVFLNHAQEYSILNAIKDSYRCDQTLVETAFTRHPSGLYVLSLPEAQLGGVALDVEELGRFLDVLKGLFGCIVVAADGMTGIDALKVLIERATSTAVLSEQSILASRSSQHLVRALRGAECRLEHTALVVDRHQRRQGLEPAKLAELLQLPLLDSLGGDAAARLQAMNAGESLFKSAPRDEYCQDVQRLSHAMMERRAPEGTPDTRSFFGRWLG